MNLLAAEGDGIEQPILFQKMKELGGVVDKHKHTIETKIAKSKSGGTALHTKGDDPNGGCAEFPPKCDPSKEAGPLSAQKCVVCAETIPIMHELYKAIEQCLISHVPDLDKSALCSQKYNTPGNRVDDGSLVTKSKTAMKLVVACGDDVGDSGYTLLTPLKPDYLRLAPLGKAGGASNDNKRRLPASQGERVVYKSSGAKGSAMTMGSSANIAWLHGYTAQLQDGAVTSGVRVRARDIERQ